MHAVLFADKDREEFRGEWCAPGVPRINDDREVHETSPIPEWLRTIAAAGRFKCPATQFGARSRVSCRADAAKEYCCRSDLL